jgi:glutathione peroxidase
MFASLFSSKSSAKETLAENAYAFSFSSLMSSEPLPLSQFKGKVILIVNTASECGFTPQYKDLETLYQKYKDKGLVVIGVPSNDFGKQEPGSSEQIAKFCEINYGVTFPIAKKEIVSGKHAHPFYVWAKSKLGSLSAPKWNFSKYLIDTNGNLADYYVSTTKPMDGKITKKIETLLAN